MSYNPQIPSLQGLELSLAIIGVFVAIFNSLQTLLDQVYPARKARGAQSSVKPFYHGLLAIGGIIVSIGAFIAAFQIHGKLFAGSESCNEILAYLFTIGLLRVLYATLGVLRVFNGERIRCRVFSVLVVLTVLVIITPILWILGLIWMFRRDNHNKWKLLSYLPNGVTLCILSFTLLLFAIFFLPNQIKTVQEPKRRKEVYVRLMLIFIFSALLGGYTLWDAHKVYETNSYFISPEPRPYDTVKSTVITRAIAEFFLVTFTVLMWSPLYPKQKVGHAPQGPRESITKGNGTHYEQTNGSSALTSDAFKTPSTTPSVTPSVLAPYQQQQSLEDSNFTVHGSGDGLPGVVDDYKVPLNDSPPDHGRPLPPPIPLHYLRGGAKRPQSPVGGGGGGGGALETRELLRQNVPSSSSSSESRTSLDSKSGPFRSPIASSSGNGSGSSSGNGSGRGSR